MKTMKRLQLIVLVIGFAVTRSAILHAGGTNDDLLTQPYEKLTGVVLGNLKGDQQQLMTLETSDRHLKTILWLKLLDQIDRTRDMSFDGSNPTNSVFSNIAPPIDPGNPKTVLYFAGIAPSEIKEPEIREAYEEALRKNHEKYLRMDFEHQLERLDKDCTRYAVQYFNATYAKTAGDAKELVGCLDIVSDPNHREDLRKRLDDFVRLSEGGH
jgi:hypothetical protein